MLTTNQADQQGPHEQGFDAFLADVNARVDEAEQQGQSTRDFVLQCAERYSNICLQDAPRRPKQFFKQMSGLPPVCFGAVGFRQSIIDDQEPARHYTAFVFVGYWLPSLLAIPLLWAWEILGFFRYGHWSQADVRSGYIGIRHGRAVRKEGHTVWPALIQRDLGQSSD